MTAHNVIALPSWHRSTEAWARDRTAPTEIRRAAIEALAEADSPVLAHINDPEGIRMVSEARNRRWANASSEITKRPDMAQIETIDQIMAREARNKALEASAWDDYNAVQMRRDAMDAWFQRLERAGRWIAVGLIAAGVLVILYVAGVMAAEAAVAQAAIMGAM